MGVRRTDEVQDFLIEREGDFELVVSTGKVRCLLNGHELPPRIDGLRDYVKGKSYHKAKKFAKNRGPNVNFQKYQPYVIQHLSQKDKLYCIVTKRTLNRDISEVENHVKGRRYLNSLAAYQAFNAKKSKTGEDHSDNDPDAVGSPSGSDGVSHGDSDRLDEAENSDFEIVAIESPGEDVDMEKQTAHHSSSSSDDSEEQPKRKPKRTRKGDRKAPKKVRQPAKRRA